MRKLIRDTRLLFGRSLMVSLRNPIWLILGLFQPALYLLLFAPLLNGLEGAPGFPRGGALMVFTPGLLVMMGLFGSAFVGYGLIADLRAGVVERLRVTPVSRLALLLGLVLRDVVTLLVQAGLLVPLTVAMGLRPDPVGLLLMVGLLALIALALASISYALALIVKDENAMASTLNTFTMPLLLLSGIMLPLSLAPETLRTIARLNPFSHAVDAARALFSGDLGSSAVVLGFGSITLLMVLAVWWAVRSFRQATA